MHHKRAFHAEYSTSGVVADAHIEERRVCPVVFFISSALLDLQGPHAYYAGRPAYHFTRYYTRPPHGRAETRPFPVA